MCHSYKATTQSFDGGRDEFVTVLCCILVLFSRLDGQHVVLH